MLTGTVSPVFLHLARLVARSGLQREKNCLILSRMAGKPSEREKNRRILSRTAEQPSEREKNRRILSRMAGKPSGREKNRRILSRTAEQPSKREKNSRILSRQSENTGCPAEWHIAVPQVLSHFKCGKTPTLEIAKWLVTS